MKTYHSLITEMRNDSLRLGGKLLNHTDSIVLDLVPAQNITPSYMQENFDLWKNKPYASHIFSEYYNNWTIPMLNTSNNGTCRCSKAQFTYLENFPDITGTWSEQKQAEHIDYVLDIKEFQNMFCEDICGDVKAYHGIVSRNTHEMTNWIVKMDNLRHSLMIEDYVERPLRIWMYKRESLIQGIDNYSTYKIDWTSVGKQYRMYAVEYLLQDYFKRFNLSNNISRHQLVWVREPLLADYYIVPHDLMYFYFNEAPEILNATGFDELRKNLNEDYFKKFLDNLYRRSPYWTMAKHADQLGSNHIFAFPGGRAMGYLYEEYQKQIKNVIQLVFTGLRQDLLPSDTPIPYAHYGTVLTYRHRYDIVMPQFTDIRANSSVMPLWDISYHKKNRLFYFAGTLSHYVNSISARPKMSSLWRNMTATMECNKTIQIGKKPYYPLLIINGHVTPTEYTDAMLSSVFSLCPEGFLPWSPRLYEALQLGAVPVILADNVVLPFERFVDWKSFSAKINVTDINNMVTLVRKIPHFNTYVKEKLKNATSYMHTFKWPYKIVTHKNSSKYEFAPKDDLDENAQNTLHYLALEMRCRRLEQFYGLTSDSLSPASAKAQEQACKNYPTICPCHNKRQPLAFQEYF